MGALLQDLRYALRSLAKNPGFTATVLATLALSIGSTVAIFSVAFGVLLKPLPYRDPERLVRIGHLRPQSSAPGSTFSPQDFEDLEAAHPGLERVAAWSYFPNLSGVNLTGLGEPERLAAAQVSGGFFETLGVPARVGRTLAPGDDRAGRNHVAVVSSSLWRRRFGADPGIVGRPISLDGTPFTVVGVLPPSLELPAAEVDLWIPLSTVGEEAVPHRREVRWLDVIGRLKRDATPETARAGVGALMARLAAQYRESNAGFDRALVTPLSRALTGDVRTPILVLLGAVGLVLLIGCVNVANLLLARAAARHREVGIRVALGASRGRLVRQFLTESMLLSLCGGALGLLLARWGVDALLSLSSGRVPRAGGIGMDPAVLAFALLLALVTGAAFGLLPALSASRGGLRNAIESGGGRSATEGSGGRNLRRGLVLCEITLAVALLFGAGLLMRSFWRLTHAESGIRPDSVLSLSISIPESVFVAEKDAAYRGALLSSLRALPGVVAAGASKTLPLQGGGEPYGYTVEGRPDLKTAKPEGGAIIVTSGYFAALRIPVVRGRDFTEADFETGRPVLLINRALSRSLWGNADPVGKGLTFGGRMRIEVIGVVGDVRQEGLDRAPLPIVYVPMSLFPRGSLKIFIRSSGDLGALAAAARATIHRLDPDQAISGVAPLSDVVSSTLARPRFLTLLVGVFGAAALLLAAIGIYGVVSYSVSRRTREIGVRVALGADRAAVRRLILGEGMSLAAAGLGLGLLVALALARTLRSVLFETRAHDPATILAVAGLLSLVSLLACAIPATRAARMDPQRALRADE